MRNNNVNPKKFKSSPKIDNYSFSNQNSENIFDNESQGQSKQDNATLNFDEYFEKNYNGDFLQRKTSRSGNLDDSDEQIPLDKMSEDGKNLSEKYGSLDYGAPNKIYNSYYIIPSDVNFNFNLTTKAQTNNIINLKKKDVIDRNDNLRKEIMKIPVNIVKPIIEKIINAKLPINLDKIFGFSYRQNKAALKLKIYEILCFKLENRNILENAKPKKKDEKIYLYLLTRTYEFIYENYINNNRIFKIGEDDIEIKEFKIFNDIIEERYNQSAKEVVEISESKNKTKKYDENGVSEFVGASKGYFEKLKNGLFDERTPKTIKFFVRRIIDKFEDYINNENKGI